MQHGIIHVTSKAGLDIAPNPKSAQSFQGINASETQKMKVLSCCWSLTGTGIFHGKEHQNLKTGRYQLEDFTSLVKPGSRPDHDGTTAENTLARHGCFFGLATLPLLKNEITQVRQ